MQSITAGKDSRHRGHEVLIYHRAFGDMIHFNVQHFRDFIFRNQAHRKDDAVTGYDLFRAFDGYHMLIHSGCFNSFNSIIAEYPSNGSSQVQRYVEII